jgi:two-component sensor histidine kinase
MDIKTVFLSSHILNFILSLIIFVIWIYYRKSFKGLTYYLFGIISISTGNFLITLRESSLAIFGIVISNVLITLGLVFISHSLIRLLLPKNTKKSILLYSFPVFILIGQTVFGYVIPDLTIRIMIMSAVPLVLMIINIIIVKKSIAFKTLPGFLIMTISFILGTTMLIRLIITPLTLNSKSFLNSGNFQAITMFIWMISIITFSVSIIILIFNELQRIEANLTLEKEQLIKEMDHRIKNNLSAIHGILNLHHANEKNENIKSIIKEIDSRIKTITNIHNLLYKKSGSKTVDLNNYLSEIVYGVLSSYNLHYIKVEIDIPEITLNYTNAMNYGLVVNEIITNACKHAFDDKNSGRIILSFQEKPKEDIYELRIKDNGKGLPENFDLKQQNSMGIKLIKSFAENQKGKIDIETSKKGTEFSIIIPIQERK